MRIALGFLRMGFSARGMVTTTRCGGVLFRRTGLYGRLNLIKM